MGLGASAYDACCGAGSRSTSRALRLLRGFGILVRHPRREAAIPGTQQTTSSIREYLRALRRRWKWMVGIMLAAVAVAAALSYTTTPVYQATAQLTFVRQPDIASALSGMSSIGSVTEAQVQSQTYAELMTTGEMRGRAAKVFGQPIPNDVEVAAEYVPDTAVLRISARSTNPKEAQAVANAYAVAFTDWRKNVTVAPVRRGREDHQQPYPGLR